MPVLTLEQVEPPFAVSCSRIVNGAGERIRQYPWGTMNGPCLCCSVSGGGSLMIVPFIFGSYLSHVDSRDWGVFFSQPRGTCTLMCVVSPGVSTAVFLGVCNTLRHIVRAHQLTCMWVSTVVALAQFLCCFAYTTLFAL